MRNEKCNFKGEYLFQLIKMGLEHFTLECFTVDSIISPLSNGNYCLRGRGELLLNQWLRP